MPVARIPTSSSGTGIYQQITRLTNARDAIAAAIAAKGVSVPSGTKLDGLAAYVGNISSGGQPRNLLDNSWFAAPIYQVDVGETHGGTQTYAVDRWKLVSGQANYEVNTGLALNGTISQVLETTPGTTSAFVGMASGTATITRSGNTVTIQSSGGVIKWAALYEGTYTADNMPEYQYKGYAAEELECKRYFGVVDDWESAQGAIDWENKLALFIPWPVQMRIDPTGTVVNGSIIVDGTYVGINNSPSAVISYNNHVNVRFDYTVDGDHKSRPVVVTLGNTPFYFSADL